MSCIINQFAFNYDINLLLLKRICLPRHFKSRYITGSTIAQPLYCILVDFHPDSFPFDIIQVPFNIGEEFKQDDVQELHYEPF